jgi:formylglycine-generating enzyme required for sulfatase activity
MNEVLRRIIITSLVLLLVAFFVVLKGKLKEEVLPVPLAAEQKAPEPAPTPTPAPTQASSQQIQQTQTLIQDSKPEEEKPKTEKQIPSQSFTNSIGMKFVLIPSGSFTMGSSLGESSRRDDETQHRVTVSRSFYLQTTEVTQGQWQRIREKNPSHFSGCGEDCPVERVSWNFAREFIRNLNQKENTNKYRLPTEAEWEYAARGGRTDDRWAGTGSETYLTEYAWYSVNSGGKTHPVGQKRPNGYGLFDMSGNVWEWCQDWYGSYPSGPVADPKGPSSGHDRVLRGGSWNDIARYVRSAVRVKKGPEDHGGFGFRVARDN